MTVRIVQKNSQVEDKRPTAAQLADGEIAVNLHEAGAFLTVKDTAGQIQQVGGVKVSAAAPNNPAKGTFWVRSSDNTLFVHDGSAWRAVSGGGGSGGGGGAVDSIVGGTALSVNPAGGTGTVTVNLDLYADANEVGLQVVSDTLKARIATASSLGSIKVGDGLNIDGAGVLSADLDLSQTLKWKGPVDLSAAKTINDATAVAGDVYINEADNTNPSNGWVTATNGSLISTTTVRAGDLVIASQDSPGAGDWIYITSLRSTNFWNRATAGSGTFNNEAYLFPINDTGGHDDNAFTTGAFITANSTIGTPNFHVNQDGQGTIYSNSLNSAVTTGTGLAMVNGSNALVRAMPKNGIEINSGQIQIDADWKPGTGDGNGTLGFWKRTNATDLLEPATANDNIFTDNGYIQTDNEFRVSDGTLTSYATIGFTQTVGGTATQNLRVDTPVNSTANQQRNGFSFGYKASNTTYGFTIPYGNTQGLGTSYKTFEIRPATMATGNHIYEGFSVSSAADPYDIVGQIDSWTGFNVNCPNYYQDSKALLLAGIYLRIKKNAGSRTDSQTPVNFGLLSVGTAPSYHKGDFHIGGDHTRNTLEAWKATLTEEERQQYLDGTLAAPADVAEPGDGAYLRARWYEEQTAEDQALLDAGELEYPENLKPENFNDSFALGDSTNLDLMTNGLVRGGGIEFHKNWVSSNVESRGIVFSSSKTALLASNRPASAGADCSVFLARVDPTSYNTDGTKTAVNAGTCISFKAESPLGAKAGGYGTYNQYVGFWATDTGQTDNDAKWTGSKNSYGFYSGVSDRSVSTGQTFGFYAAGDAPNFLTGSLYIGGTTNSLGDNTQINLLSSGIIEGRGYSFTKSATATNVEYRGMVYSSSYDAILSVSHPETEDDTTADVTVHQARVDTIWDDSGTKKPSNIGVAKSFLAQPPLTGAAYGTCEGFRGFSVKVDNYACWTGGDNFILYHSNMKNETAGTSGKRAYTLYSEDDAFSYHNGLIGQGIKTTPAYNIDVLSQRNKALRIGNSASNGGVTLNLLGARATDGTTAAITWSNRYNDTDQADGETFAQLLALSNSDDPTGNNKSGKLRFQTRGSTTGATLDNALEIDHNRRVIAYRFFTSPNSPEDRTDANSLGCRMDNINGVIHVTRASTATTQSCLNIGRQGTNTPTINLKANGDAVFQGDVTANNVTFELAPEDPANYVAATTTDIHPETGEEIEVATQVYNGPVLNVKEVLLELQQRVADRDAVIADLTTRLETLEAAVGG